MGFIKGIRSYIAVVVFILNSSLSYSQNDLPCADIGITNSLNLVTNVIPANIVPGQDFCVEFTAENFSSIVGFQFTMNFDPTSISFVSFEDNLGLMGDPILPNLTEADNGIMTFLWINFAATGLTLPDGSLIFTICFRANTEPDPCVPLSITNALAPLFPDTEVNFQISEDEKCKDSIILLDGMQSTCIEIDCAGLSITCSGICNSNSGMGGIRFTACGGVAPYAVILETPNFVIPLDTIWNDFEKIETTGMPAGPYTIRIIDANGDQTTQNFIIDALPGVSYDPIIAVDPICSNISNGSITIENLTSGLPGELFDISFSNGITFQDVTEATFDRLVNGDYSITITDMNGCETVEDVTLFTPPLVLDIDLTPASCFGSDDGAISATASGGTPINGTDYNYNNIISETFETLTPYEDNAFNNITNRYRLRVTDDNGCSVEENIEIPVAKVIEVEITDVIDNVCKFQCEGSLTLNVLTPGRYTFLVRDQDNNFITLGGNDGQSLFYNSELCAGEYSVMIRDTSGCSIDTFFTILEPQEELIADPQSFQASCNMGDGQAIVNVSGGMAPYDFNWELAPGVNNNILDNVMAGIYNVAITDDLGCVIDTFVEVLSGDVLEIEAFILDNLECDGSGNGQLSVNILDSSSIDHNFEWTDEDMNVLANTQILDFNSAGTYIIEVSSTDGACTALDTIVISSIPGLIVNFTWTEPSCPQASDGSIDINDISGGIEPYDCIWEDSSISSCNPTDLMEGIYNVTIVDSDGCEKDTFVELTAMMTDIVFDIIVRLPSCPGEEDGEVRIDNINGGTGPYSCVWEDPTIVSCNPTGLAPGTYNFAVIDVNGCAKDTFVTINESIQFISFDLDVTNPICGGDPGSIILSNLDGTYPPIDVSWSEPGINGLMATGLSAGEITITFTDGRLCTQDTTIVLINEDNDFQLTIDATPPDCAVGLDNGTISFPGFDSVNGTCEWEDTDLNAQNCTVIGLAPGIYNVTLTDVNGCQKDTFVDLTVEERLEIDLSNIMDVSCFGGMDGQATVTVINNPLGAPDFNFFWTNPADDDQGVSDDASQLSAGDNSVYAFDGLCTSDTISFTINEPDAIILDTNVSSVQDEQCFGECDGTADLAATGGTIVSGDYEYLWEDGFMGSQRTGLCPGLYYITISDDNDCEFRDSIIINDAILLELEIDTASLMLISCGNDDTGAMSVNASGGCGNFSYSWTNNVSTGPTATDLSPGIYGVTVTDGCGCTNSVSYQFESSTPVVATAITPDVPECQGDKVCIGIESASGGTGLNYTYSINFGNRIDIDSCVMVDPGNYTLLVFDSAGCSAELQVSVDTAPEFSVDIGPDIDLDLGDNEAMVSAITSGGIPSYAFEWSSEAEFNCMSGDCSTISLNPFSSTTVELIVTDQNGCTAKDDLNITLKTERNVYVPNIFNPNGLAPDNKFMILTGNGVEEVVSFRVFDRWGNLMFENSNIPAPTSTDDGWDGRYGPGGNNKVEQGVYVYTAEVRFVDNVTLNYRGEITIIR